MGLSPNPEQWSNHITGLKPLVIDQPSLITAIDECLKPSKAKMQHKHWEKKQAKRKEARRAATCEE